MNMEKIESEKTKKNKRKGGGKKGKKKNWGATGNLICTFLLKAQKATGWGKGVGSGVVGKWGNKKSGGGVKMLHGG